MYKEIDEKHPFSPEFGGKYFLYFYGEGCINCEMMKPLIQMFPAKFLDVTFLAIKAQDNPMLAKMFQIKYLPTFILYENEMFSVVAKGITQVVKLENFIKEFKVRRKIPEPGEKQ